MHVLITGGCGYVGSALIPQLQHGDEVHEITILDSLVDGSPANLLAANLTEGLHFVEGDVRDYGAVERATRDVDAVIHLAAITGAADTHDKRDETFAVNLEGTRNVLNAARKHGVENFVLASSCNVYGCATSEDLDESTAPDPINPYAETKLDAEALLQQHADEIDSTALRMSTVYGHAPGIRFNLVVNGFVFRALTDRPLTVYGDGSNWRPFVHVEDAARAFADAACNPHDWPAPVYNVGANAENYRIETIADVVRRHVNRDLEITYLEDEYPGPSYHVNFDRLDHTGFRTRWTLDDGIRDLATRFSSEKHTVERAIDETIRT